MDELENEKLRQNEYQYARATTFDAYNSVLAYYQAMSCLENAHGTSLLDMPCGDGLVTSMMGARFERVVGVDASGKHLSEARKRVPSGEFYEALIEELQTDERFDTITMLNVLEHVMDPVAVLGKAASLLKAEGTLILHVPNSNAINRRIAVLMGTLETLEELSPFDLNVAGHRRSYTLQTLIKDVHRAGLKVRKTGGIFYKMLSTAQMDWFLRNGLWKEGGFGWGRVGGPKKDWKTEFCQACYEIGKERPEDCNVIYACVAK